MVKSKYSKPWKLENSSNFRNFYLALYGIKYVVADVIPEMLMLFLLLNYKSPKIAKLTRNFISPFQFMYDLFIWLYASLKHINRMHIVFVIITVLINRDKTQNDQGMIFKKKLFDVEVKK